MFLIYLPSAGSERFNLVSTYAGRLRLILFKVTEIFQTKYLWNVLRDSFFSTERESAVFGFGISVIFANQCGLWNLPQVWNILDSQSFVCLKCKTSPLRCPGVK